jgi:CRP-like cAMP-binding protein
MFYEEFVNGIGNSDCKNNYTLPHFLTILPTLKKFEAENPTIFDDLFYKKDFEKGEILIREGELLNSFFFVEKGFVRSYSMIKGKERTIQFAFPAEFTGAFSNSTLNAPCDVTIEVLTDATIWVFSWEKWNHHKVAHPELEGFERLNSASYIMALNERINDLLFLSTYERYEKLLNKKPQFVKRLPLKYIADYLGCTKENISRIRSMMSR